MSRLRPDKKWQRQQEAEKRQLWWQNLSPQEQLAELDERGVAATKQRAKILARIEE